MRKEGTVQGKAWCRDGGADLEGLVEELVLGLRPRLLREKLRKGGARASRAEGVRM